MSPASSSESAASANGRALQQIKEDGYCILENVIEPELLDGITAAIKELTLRTDAKAANNDFEGRETLRLYNLLAHGGIFADIPPDPFADYTAVGGGLRVVALVEAVVR